MNWNIEWELIIQNNFANIKIDISTKDSTLSYSNVTWK